MSMYVPEIKEEVSENAKMLVVEEDGKIYRAGMPSGGSYIVCVDADYKVTGDFVEAEKCLLNGGNVMLKRMSANGHFTVNSLTRYFCNTSGGDESNKSIEFSCGTLFFPNNTTVWG